MLVLLEINDLEVSYNKIKALHGVTFTVVEGSLTSIVGNNGAGKSTIMRTISGTLKPDQGTIEFKGESIAGNEPNIIAKKGIAHVPEGRQIFSNVTVEENLKLGAYQFLNSMSKKELEVSMEEMYTRFPSLKKRKDLMSGHLSGGEQQMLAIARALMSKPNFLMFDEPSLGLAPVIVDQIFELIMELKNEGKTILLVEQRATQAIEISDDVYVMRTGNIVFHGQGNNSISEEELKQYYLGIK